MEGGSVRGGLEKEKVISRPGKEVHKTRKVKRKRGTYQKGSPKTPVSVGEVSWKGGRV